mmetsp:Transcript_4351/g.14731  ORF Transcript_4351/g.14731 Transcript_4351/m.14731 type:complete len:344 (+) Transcript_4351:37-1068(+)
MAFASRARLLLRPVRAPVALPCAALGLYGAKSWSDFNAVSCSPDEQAAEGGLPAPVEASRLQAVRLPALLSAGEIQELLEVASDVRASGLATLHRTGTSNLAVVHLQDSVASSLSIAAPPWKWRTTYLHVGHTFQQRLGPLCTKLQLAALSVDADHWGICASASRHFSAHRALSGPDGVFSCDGCRGGEGGHQGKCDDVAAWINVRTVELHEVAPGGSLPHRDHFDNGSCVTIDVMLSEPGVDFTGGRLEMPAAVESQDSAPKFEQGDAIVFPSHKHHCVQPVARGLRRVLVLELWCGAERSCPHRCEQHWGTCSCELGPLGLQHRLKWLLHAAATEDPVRPW